MIRMAHVLSQLEQYRIQKSIHSGRGVVGVAADICLWDEDGHEALWIRFPDDARGDFSVGP